MVFEWLSEAYVKTNFPFVFPQIVIQGESECQQVPTTTNKANAFYWTKMTQW